MNKGILIISFLALLAIQSCKKKDPLDNVDCSKVNAAYAVNVKPIINANCVSSGCHNANSVNGDFTSYAGLKAKADNGSLNSRVIQQKTMPPSSPLSLSDLKSIKCWIDSGSPNN